MLYTAAAPGMCASCGRPMDEYTEEVIALCLVAVGTCCHRLPRTVSSYLISSVIPAIAKYVLCENIMRMPLLIKETLPIL